MDDEQFWGAACAGSDLTARLGAELLRAHDGFAVAQARLVHALSRGLPTAPLRAEARSTRRQVRSLLRVLQGMPDFAGGDDARAAGFA